ncbi:DNA translocase FtsK [Pelagimonas phthalicica]|uniref:DNA translocase FtsK n=1 Tax=Pelagimonas phthalicica TaxID=1037362 RepID=A0A238J9L2_9RHOB|nr:DNA translocase FtsK [Pelagimonas phthalicica]TDS94595.1 DNA translocase FtsK [Pelagimonas phthalicica]SMX26877.1 DNA translocase FtsK [Pelagimonas phthalicica]
MASFQARGRDPLFDTDTAATLERRGRELIGMALIVLGVMAAAAIASYSANDPSWFSASDAPIQNWMGRPGALFAAPLYTICGVGSWAIAATLIAWGLRFVSHRGEGRFFLAVFSPIWIALCSVYAAGLPQAEGWSHSFGMGGLFGDMVMGSLLNILPVSAAVGLKIMQVLLAGVILAMGALVLGFTKDELRGIARFLIVGVVVTYATLMKLVGRGAVGAVGAAQRVQAAQAEKREARRVEAAEAAAWAEAQEAVPAAPRVQRAEIPQEAVAEDDYLVDEADMVEPAPAKTGFLSRMPSLIRRGGAEPMPEPEMVANVMEHDVEAPNPDRIQSKIADAVKSRRRTSPVAVRPQHDPSKPLTKGRGHGPQPLIVDTAPRGTELPPEPPLTAGFVPEAPMMEAVEEMVETALPPAPELAAEPQIDHYAEMADFDDYGAQDYTPVAEPEIVSEPTPAPRMAQPHMPIPKAEPKKAVVQQPVRKPIQPSKRAQAEAQPQLQFDDNKPEYELPPLGLLMSPEAVERHHLSDEALEENARMLEAVLDDYGVKGEIVSVRPGPVVTMYELEPAPGLKASRVIGLADDIARSMSALSARVSTVPGRSVIGIELPNDKREMVCFREILAGREFGDGNHKLPLALGKDIGGDPVVANLAKMPHLLIAGTTGSGKSVAINTMILSLLYKLSPDDCRLIMIDPKMLELSVYDGIPHLLSPVVTDPKKAVVALKWVVGEMEDRYRKMSKMGVRNIDGYNGRVADALAKGELFERTVQTGFDDETGEPVFETEQIEPKKMPYIVVIVDEMADLMMVAGKEIEACIQRLAQMARASGIHLIMATQRPSVDVITGTIKANFPTRISFQVTSKIDSRTILGEMGAEQLLGMGDMLYMAGGAKITRCHGPFVSDEEVEEIVNHLKAFGPPEYVSGVVAGPDEDKASNIDAVLGLNTGGNTNGEDALYDQAVAIVIKDRKCSTSYIQRKLGIGYNKAARLVEQMEDEGVVSGANHVGKREILVPEQ